MEEQRRPGPLKVIGLILLFVLLAVSCYLAMGLSDLSMGLGNWGIYTTGTDSVYLAAAYLQTDTDDLLICDRRGIPADGGLVTYLMEGRRTVDHYDDLLGRPVLAVEGSWTEPEPVSYILHDGGGLLRLFHRWRWCIWGFTAGLLTVLLVSRITRDARWRRRQQNLMLKNFRTYGDKYAKEEEDLNY